MVANSFFEQFKLGQKTGLLSIIDQERPHLYDYAMRMVGQQKLVLEAMDQLADRYLAKREREPADVRILRIDLYRELRRSHLGEWNADTHSLENEALLGMNPETNDGKLTAALDVAFRKLAGPEREVCLLSFVRGYSFDETAYIMGVSSQRAADLTGLALQRLDQIFKERVPFPESFSYLQPHPMPGMSTHATVAVSQLIRNVSNAKKIYSPLRQLRWAFGVLILVIMGLILAWPYIAPKI